MTDFKGTIFIQELKMSIPSSGLRKYNSVIGHIADTMTYKYICIETN